MPPDEAVVCIHDAPLACWPDNASLGEPLVIMPQLLLRKAVSRIGRYRVRIIASVEYLTFTSASLSLRSWRRNTGYTALITHQITFITGWVYVVCRASVPQRLIVTHRMAVSVHVRCVLHILHFLSLQLTGVDPGI